MRMWERLIRAFHRDERGITGLETAIILIAFVVIASVFAYSVLSAGVFSSQQGKQAVYSALGQARATLVLVGSVVAQSDGSSATALVLNVSKPLGGAPVDFSPPDDVNADGLADSGSTHVAVISYYTDTIRTDDLAWTKTQVGKGDDDDMLEVGEAFEITVDLTGVGESIGTYTSFNIELKPAMGAVLKISRMLPGRLQSVMILR